MPTPPSQTWHRGWRQAYIAGALHVAGYVALAFGREPLSHWFYHWTWWTFVVAVDGVVFANRGDSLLRTRPREAGVLALLSVVFWFHFETWNLRLQDWYYIGADASWTWRAIRYTTAFATVLPGVFELYDLLEVYGIPRRVRVRPRPITPGTWPASYALGIAMFVLPILWPAYAFPLVWGAYIFLLEPLNARWGGHSFRHDWAAGDLTPFCRTLLAGAIAGGLWEMWNFWAPVKWIYTVPYFEELKLFEMPLLGFFGFPPFAVQLMCMTTCVTLLRNAAGWQVVPQVSTRGPVVPRSMWPWVCAACGVFVLVQIALTDRYTVGARQLTIAQSIWGETDAGRALVEAGYEYPAEVARALNYPADRARIAQVLDWPIADLEVVAGPILVAALPELDASDAYVLSAMGVFTVAKLAHADPRAIASGFPRQRIPNGETRGSPSARRAKMWIQAAQRELARRPAWRRAALSAPRDSAMMPGTDVHSRNAH